MAGPPQPRPPGRRLSSRQIEVFRTVMIAGSLTAAGAQLNVSQPSLTRLVRRVEDVVGFPLFDRVKGRLVPTAEARTLFARVEHIQAQLDALDDAIGRIAQGEHGPLRLGASPSLARQLVPSALAGFRARFPRVPIHLDVLTLAGIVDYLALGRGECVLTMTPIRHPAVDSRAIWPGRLVALIPAAHTLAQRPEVSAEDLIDQPLIICEPDTPHGRLARDLFATVGAVPTVSVIIRFAETAIGLTGAGLGIAVVDEFTAMDAASDRVAVRPITGPPCFQVHLNRNANLVASRFVAAVEAALIAVLRTRR